MEVLEIIKEGILKDELSLWVFQVIVSIFLIDLVLYITSWINLIILNRAIRNGNIYKMPLSDIIDGFKDLIQVSTHEINTRAYVDDFFSRLRVVIIPFPLFSSIRVPLISGIKFIKDTVSIFILVGVLGTFVGIYTSLVSVLNTGSNGILTGLDSITPVLSGMGTAFATSIVGMSFALLTSLLLKLFNVEQFLSGIMARLENYLDNEIKIARKSHLSRSLEGIERNINEGFQQMAYYNHKIYDSLKGFEAFSKQFQEAADYMETFNNNLAGSMEDLKEFYQTNRDFTQNFSNEVQMLGKKLEQLFASIDSLTAQQEQVASLIEGDINVQEHNISVLDEIGEQSADSRKELKESYQLFRQQLKKDSERIESIFTEVEKAAEKQNQIARGYYDVLGTLQNVQEQITSGFENNVKELNQTMEELRGNYNNEMSRNIKTFAEHVSLSNKIINKGFDTLIDRFDNMDSTMGKYLGGLAFNASDLEGTINELSRIVRSVEEAIKNYNNSVQEFKDILKLERSDGVSS